MSAELGDGPDWVLCDSCRSSIDDWVCSKTQYRGWVQERTTVAGRNTRSIESYHALAAGHRALVRRQVALIRGICSSRHQLNEVRS